METESDWFPYVEEITKALVTTFGQPTLGNKRNPFDELVYVLLATKTPPDRYQRVYAELKRKYPKFDDLTEASIEELADVFQPAGFGRKRAEQLSEIAKHLRSNFGRVTLSPLKDVSDHEAEDFLVRLPGVGIKMARCVLMYSLNREVFPVDTHCFRISKRLDWLSTHTTYTKGMMNFLQGHVPPKLRHDLHVGMVVLGREYCFKQDPQCPSCPILQWCPAGKQSEGQLSI